MSNRRVTIKIIPPKSYEEFAERKVFRAPPRKHYTEASCEQAIELATEYLDKKFPVWNFRCVKVGPMDFNFIFDGFRNEESNA